jgi:DNA polymerase I
MPSYTERLRDCKGLRSVYDNEMAVLKVCEDMERTGIQIDLSYVNNSLKYEVEELRQAKLAFLHDTGHEYMDSGVLLKKIFDSRGELYGRTEKGNASFASDVLEELDTPTAKLINKIRYHEKRIGTYWTSFLYYADETGIIHPNMQPYGTRTGRFSYSNPNLQNVPVEETGSPVRRAFIPRTGLILVSIDYAAVEYKLLLDYAGEKTVIKKVLEGEDLHQVTADMMGVDRRTAKTLGFMILYGGGAAKLAKSLGVGLERAKELKKLYLARLPKVKELITAVTRTAEYRGHVKNFLGRKLFMGSYDESYKLVNHLIQGSAADVMKLAMVSVSQLLDGKPINMLLSVHDELVFEMPEEALDLVPEISARMCAAYAPRNKMKLTVNAAKSRVSWAKEDLRGC